MHKLNQNGSLVVPLVIVSFLLLGSLGFGGWAFTSRQDYKNNSDNKAAVAAKAATEAESVKKNAEFAETEKSPNKTYKGPETYGSIAFDYPKTWSVYISESSKNATVIDGYLQPNFVQDISSDNAFALRIQVVDTTYSAVLKTFDSSVKTSKATVAAYRAPKVDSVLGSVVTGAITTKKQGTMVLLPIRDKTVKIWTEGSGSLTDFNSTVLASLTFSP